MITTAKRTARAPRLAPAVLLAAAALGHAGDARAQNFFGRGGPLRNTPFDPRTIDQTARDFDQARLRQMSASPRPGRDFTKLYVKNGTPARVSVALRVDPFSRSGTQTSEPKSLDPGSPGPFSTFAWYDLGPGELIHVADTNNVNVYFYASGGDRAWAGDHRKEVPDGGRARVVGFRHVLINAGRVVEHTINLQ